MHIVCGTKPTRHHLWPPLQQPGGICTCKPCMKIGHKRQSWHQALVGPHMGQLPNSLPSTKVTLTC